MIRGLRRLAGASGALLVAGFALAATGAPADAAATGLPTATAKPTTTTTTTTPSGPRPRAGATTGGPALGLLAQSAYVTNNQSYHLELAVTVPSATTRLQVLIYSHLTTRTDFDAALTGTVPGDSSYTLAAPVSSFHADAAGGIDVNIPIDPSGSTTMSALTTRTDSGVYPVKISLADGQGNPIGTPLTTFLVYASPSAVAAVHTGGATSTAEFPRLDVALSVPVAAGPNLGRNGRFDRLDADQSDALSSLAGVLTAHSTVPVSLAASPQTLDTLAGGSSTDQATLSTLAGLASGGAAAVEPAAYAPVSLPAMVAGGLGAEVRDQVASGGAAIDADLGQAPAAGTWTVNGPLDQATLATLVANGVKRLVVPAGDLSALPEEEDETTLAAPTALNGPGNSHLAVYAADAGLTRDFTSTRSPVLAASHLLAELAMIQLETPGETRGVVVLPPAGWQTNATFLNVLLSGLDGNPLLQAVTTGTLFSSVPAAPEPGDPLVRSLTQTKPAGMPFGEGTQIRSARQALQAVTGIYPADKAQAVTLHRQLLTAEAATLSPAQRIRAAGVVAAALTKVRREISLPGAGSITLTARDGGLPITVLSSGPPGAQVRLQLSSEKLTFRTFTPPGGRCSTPSDGVELCTLTLASQVTNLKVPVEARTSGVFTLDVSLSTPDGTVLLSDTSDTLRSTAFSGVGVILIVVAGLGLAYWWIRNIRHGRRARDLVPTDRDDPDEGTGVAVRTAEDTGPAGQRAPGDALPEDWLPAGAGVAEGWVDDAAGRQAGAVPDAEAPVAGGGGPTPEPDGGEEPAWIDEDPVIAEFFATPAPDYPPTPGRSPRSPS